MLKFIPYIPHMCFDIFISLPISIEHSNFFSTRIDKFIHPAKSHPWKQFRHRKCNLFSLSLSFSIVSRTLTKTTSPRVFESSKCHGRLPPRTIPRPFDTRLRVSSPRIHSWDHTGGDWHYARNNANNHPSFSFSPSPPLSPPPFPLHFSAQCARDKNWTGRSSQVQQQLWLRFVGHGQQQLVRKLACRHVHTIVFRPPYARLWQMATRSPSSATLSTSSSSSTTTAATAAATTILGKMCAKRVTMEIRNSRLADDSSAR